MPFSNHNKIGRGVCPQLLFLNSVLLLYWVMAAQVKAVWSRLFFLPLVQLVARVLPKKAVWSVILTPKKKPPHILCLVPPPA